MELLGILKIMCDVVEGQKADKKLNSQTMELPIMPDCQANTDIDSRSDNEDVINSNSNMPDYFRPSTGREADRKAS